MLSNTHVLIIACAAIHASTNTVQGQACFSPRVVREIVDSVTPQTLCADLNGDGLVDVLAGGKVPGFEDISALRWFRNTAGNEPSFDDEIIATNIGTLFGQFFDVCDLDGDTDLDIVIGDTSIIDGQPPVHTLSWLENDGKPSPSFVTHPLAVLAASPESVACGDLDMDGHVDIAVLANAEQGGDWLYWFTNNGAEHPDFMSRNQQTSPFFSGADIQIADGDNDGLNDIVAARSSLRTLQFFRNLGGTPATFAELTLFSDLLLAPQGWCTTDLNADGYADFVLSNSIAGVIALINNGQSPPTYAPIILNVPQTSDFTIAYDIDAGDYDGDGDIDISVSTNDNFLYLYNRDDGSGISYTLSLAASTARPVWSLSSSDFDLDGDTDIVAGVFAAPTAMRWYESVHVENMTQGSRSRTIEEAMAAADPGDVITGDPIHFDGRCANDVIDFENKPVTLHSTGDLSIPSGSEVFMSHMGSLEAAPDSTFVSSGMLRTTTGSSSWVGGSSVVLAGPVDLSAGSALMSSTSVSISGQPSFLDRPVDATSFPYSGIAFADIDADDDLDIIATGSGVEWWRNDIDQTEQFTFQPSITFYDTSNSKLCAGDFDGDGAVDILVDGKDGMRWFRDTAPRDLSFLEYPVMRTGGFINDKDQSSVFLTANIDGDAQDEAVVAFDNGAAWYDYMSDGPGVLQEIALPGLPPKSQASFLAYSLCVGDVDGDGDVDIMQGTDRGAVWYENNGSSPTNFLLHELSDELDGEIGAIAIGDIDADGDADIVGTRMNTDVLLVYENQGTGRGDGTSFIQYEIPTPGDRIGALTLLDMDADGDTDVLGVSAFSSTIIWYENVGTAPTVLRRHTISAATSDLTQLGVGDLNNDGRPDIATVDLRWFENSTASTRTVGANAAILSSVTVALENATIEVLAGAEIGAADALTVDRNSTVSGAGTLAAPLVQSAGVLQPASGSLLAIDGDYEQRLDDPQFGSSSGTLRIDFGSLGDGTGLHIAGAASLAGLLEVRMPAGASPCVNTAFTILTAAGGLGADRFDAAVLPGLPDGKFFKLDYTSGGPGRGEGSVSLVVTELPSAPVDIESPEATPLAGIPTGAALGDIAGFNPGGMPLGPDGLPDLAVVIPDETEPLEEPGQLVVLVNEGDGGDGVWDGFGGGTLIAFTQPGGEEPISVSLGDLDGDKDIDLAVANRSGGSVTPVLNDGLGGIDPLPPVSAGVERPFFVASHDLNNDGRADLAVVGTDATLLGGQVAGLISAGGAGQFDTPVVTSFGTSLVYASLGDLEGDKDIDLVVADAGENAVHTFMNEPGTGAWPGFVAGQTIPVGAGVVQASLGDLDGDKDIDLLTADRNGGTVSISLNNGIGTLGPSSSLPVGQAPRSLAIVDLDSDDDDDFVVIVNDQNAPGERLVRVFRNDRNGTELAFAPALDVPSTLRPRIALSQIAGAIGPLSSRDIDADGDDDVVTVNESPPSARGSEDASAAALLQMTIVDEPCPADVTEDGVVDTFDLAQILAGWGQSGISDLTGDGTTDTFDLAVTLAGWGACP